jgi:hypothetical protein
MLRTLAIFLTLLTAGNAFAETQAIKQLRTKNALHFSGMDWGRAVYVFDALANTMSYDTAVELLAATPTEGTIGYALDTNAFYMRISTSWVGLGLSTTHTIGVPFADMRVHDDLAALLPIAAAADDIGNVPGTVGTTAASLQGIDFKGAATDEKATFSFVLPADYVAGSTVTARFNAGVLTTIADTALTLDLECWVPDYANADGTVSTDLVTPAAQSINSLTLANIDFVVDDDLTGHALAAGSVVQCRMAFAGSDTGALGVMVPIVRKIDLLITP